MIYPDEYKCLTCKKRYYGCKRRRTGYGLLLSCVDYVYNGVKPALSFNICLARCFFGCCPRKIILQNVQQENN